MRDDVIGQQQRHGRAAEVVADKIGLRAVALRKIENEFRAGIAPFIDGLVIVADGHVVTLRVSDQIENLRLRQIHILEFIH